MKKKVEKLIEACDYCGKEIDYGNHTCKECSQVSCYECAKTRFKVYRSGVYHMGSNDGEYCLPCDRNLLSLNNDELHKAYNHIQDLRSERERFETDFKVRQDSAESHLKELLGKKD